MSFYHQSCSCDVAAFLVLKTSFWALWKKNTCNHSLCFQSTDCTNIMRSSGAPSHMTCHIFISFRHAEESRRCFWSHKMAQLQHWKGHKIRKIAKPEVLIYENNYKITRRELIGNFLRHWNTLDIPCKGSITCRSTWWTRSMLQWKNRLLLQTWRLPVTSFSAAGGFVTRSLWPTERNCITSWGWQDLW